MPERDNNEIKTTPVAEGTARVAGSTGEGRALGNVAQTLQDAMISDRRRLAMAAARIERRAAGKKPFDRDFAQWKEQVERSMLRAEERRHRVPLLAYDDELPVSARRQEIKEAVAAHQVVVVCGETGSGKSTQLPKICLELGRGVYGMIGHTQPRRLAARSIAARVAEEIGSSVGGLVGFKIRFSDETGPNTLVKLMTDGILLAETQGDRDFEQYDTIILDEAHERSLNIDFLIGYLKRLLQRRTDLKLIITSATIDAERFAKHFEVPGRTVPVIEVQGRTYPVEIVYRSLVPEEDEPEIDAVSGVRLAVQECARRDSGDMLIFLPTERDIHEAVKLLKSTRIPGDSPGRETEILPLYARLPSERQQQIFKPGGRRRIVLATNVAESSLTVPRIRYVIDTGTARISRYSSRTRTQRLPIEAISRASADQRAGRCGRIGPGVCVRLYDEDDYFRRDRYTQPEIQRSNLASVILQAEALKLGDIERFPFLDPPKHGTVRDGYKTLVELGALDDEGRLTELGRTLSRLPVDPRIGRMIVAADEERCLGDVLIIAAALEVRDPRLRPPEKRDAADEAQKRFVHEESDFLTYLNIWDFYHDLKAKLSRSRLQKACVQNFLSFLRIREWCDIHRQLDSLVRDAGMRPGGRRGDYDAIHRAILTGVLSSVAFKSEKYVYTVAGNTKAHVWPGSVAFSKKPTWLAAAEIVETEKRYLRTCARIDPEWLEPLAEHLVKRTYSDPYWSRKHGSAMAKEKVTLFGLPIVVDRPMRLGPVDPAMARELLVRDGLVGDGIREEAPFVRHNRELREEMARLQKKARRSDLLKPEWDLERVFHQRLPAEVVDVATLTKWRKQVERENPRVLFLSKEDLLRDTGADVAAFPDTWETPSASFPLKYEYAPGEPHDGLTLEVPADRVGAIDSGQTDWLVPGLLESKIAALIKSLPKHLRRTLIPARETAQRAASQMRFREGPFLPMLAETLGAMAKARISTSDFDTGRLPPELTMNIAVVDGEGKPLAVGKDVDALRKELGQTVAEEITKVDDPKWNRRGITAWDFGRLRESVEIRRGNIAFVGYPALVDTGEAVSLTLAESADYAEVQTRRGVVRLVALAMKRELRGQVQWFPELNDLRLLASPLHDFDLTAELTMLLASRSLGEDWPLPRTEQEFDSCAAKAGSNLGAAVHDAAVLLPKLFRAHHEARLALGEVKNSQRWQYAAADIKRQLRRLTAPGFLIDTPWTWLQHYPRYFQAIHYRLERLRAGSGSKDEEVTEDIHRQETLYEEHAARLAELRRRDPALDHLRWMLEEYRVSLFAQKLGTAFPISAKRIEKQWEKVEGV